ncbi:hypothetical protein FJZ20_00175 [Candidatus Pacearchaeota archaeon]|nr:hypothetical protein [Candidatus Pacearchaeota archaeon]
MKKINKKGELTTKQLVIIIVLIVSFIIILFLLYRLNLGETTNKQICHNSVVLKAKSAGLAGPLDCRTNYLCISGGKECKEITPTSTVKISSKNEEDIKKEIMKALADEMSDCWWMFGEGEITYANTALTQRTSCALCSIVEFDEILKTTTSISYAEFYDYLSKTPKTTSETYLQYLYALTSSEEFPFEEYLNKNLEFDKTYSILTGMERKIIWGLFGSSHVPVLILEKNKESYETLGCDVFLTKA